MLHGKKSADGTGVATARNVTDWVDVSFGVGTLMTGRKAAPIKDAPDVPNAKIAQYAEIGAFNILQIGLLNAAFRAATDANNVHHEKYVKSFASETQEIGRKSVGG